MKKKVSVVLTALCLAIISVFALAACAPRPVNEETRVNGFSFREYGDGYEVANYLGDETEIKALSGSGQGRFPIQKSPE